MCWRRKALGTCDFGRFRLPPPEPKVPQHLSCSASTGVSSVRGRWHINLASTVARDSAIQGPTILEHIST